MRDAAGQNAQAFQPLRVPQLFLRALLTGDIDPDSHQPRRFSGIVQISAAAHQHPARLVRAMRIAKLGFEQSLILPAPGKDLPHGFAIVAMNQGEEAFPRPIGRLGRKAEDLRELGRPYEPVILQLIGPGAHHGRFRSQAQAFFTLP